MQPFDIFCQLILKNAEMIYFVQTYFMLLLLLNKMPFIFLPIKIKYLKFKTEFTVLDMQKNKVWQLSPEHTIVQWPSGRLDFF